MKIITIIILITAIILTGCGSAGTDSTPAPETSTPVPTTTLPAPTTTVSMPITTAPVPIATVPDAPQPTDPWEAEPIFSPESLLAQLSDDTRQQILRDYCATNTDVIPDMLSLRVFGIFGDAYALFVDGEIYPDTETTEVVGNYKFCYASSQKLLFYRGGQFYSLHEAMEEQVITENELQIVFDNYYGAYPHLWALYYETDE